MAYYASKAKKHPSHFCEADSQRDFTRWQQRVTLSISDRSPRTMTDPNQPSSAPKEPILKITPVPRATSEKYQLSPTLDLDSPTGVYIPANLQEAIIELEKMLHPELIEEIKACHSERDVTGTYHFGLAMWMRGNWALWQGSRLAEFLTSQGVSHPDDMSSAILIVFWKHLNQDSRNSQQ